MIHDFIKVKYSFYHVHYSFFVRNYNKVGGVLIIVTMHFLYVI